MATSTPKQKPSTKSNTSKRTSLKASSKFDIRIIALLAVLLVAVVGYLFIRFSKAGTGTQWLPKAWTNQATEFDSPAAGTLVAGTCDYVNDYVQNGIQYTKRVCTPVGVSAGVGGKTAFQLPDNTYIVGKPSKYVDLQHKVPASLASPSEYCISYSSMKPIYLKWNNKTVPSSPDYVVGGVAGNDSATLPATNGVVSEWCSGPYPANPGVVLSLEPVTNESTAYIYSASSRMAASKLSWSGNELSPIGTGSVSGSNLVISAGTTPGGFTFTDMSNYGAGKYCYASSGYTGGPNTKLEWISQEQRWDNDVTWDNSASHGGTANVMLPAVKSATECITVPAVSPGNSPRRTLTFQLTSGNMSVTRVYFTPASTATATNTPTSTIVVTPATTKTPVPTATVAPTVLPTTPVLPATTVQPTTVAEPAPAASS